MVNVHKRGPLLHGLYLGHKHGPIFGISNLLLIGKRFLAKQISERRSQAGERPRADDRMAGHYPNDSVLFTFEVRRRLGEDSINYALPKLFEPSSEGGKGGFPLPALFIKPCLCTGKAPSFSIKAYQLHGFDGFRPHGFGAEKPTHLFAAYGAYLGVCHNILLVPVHIALSI